MDSITQPNTPLTILFYMDGFSNNNFLTLKTVFSCLQTKKFPNCQRASNPQNFGGILVNKFLNFKLALKYLVRATNQCAFKKSFCKYKMSNASKTETSWWTLMFKDMMLGGTAGAISKTVAAPLERVKLLLQTQDANFQLAGKKYTGFANCMQRVYTEEGFLAYWRGNWANVVRYFPTTALNFGFKDFYRRQFVNANPATDKYRYGMQNVLAGGLAGCSCMVFVYPLDFARTRMGADVGKDMADRQFQSLTHCMKTIFAKDGMAGLYQGVGISLFSNFIYRGLYFGAYDTGKDVFKDQLQDSFFYKWCFAQVVVNFSEIVSYPFDTVRRRLMMNSGLDKPIYNGTVDCFR
jgi:solute carrier family 25 (adenine nucleotide translocator) protein 4/5/6/31